MDFCPIFYAYRITNDVNRKLYFGITSKLPHERWYYHVYEATKTQTGDPRGIKGAIRRYGSDNFTMTIEKICRSIDELKETEQYLIEHHQTNRTKYPDCNGYNLTDGGDNYDCGLVTSYRNITVAKKAQQKPVIVENKNGTLLSFDTMIEAIEYTGIHRMTVINLLKTGKWQRSGNWRFRYNEHQLYNSDGTLNYFGTQHFGAKSAKKPKHKYVITLKDGTVKEYDRVVDASKDLGIHKSAFFGHIRRRRMGVDVRDHRGILADVKKVEV